ncbi:hypothetical protein bcCo53_001666 (plasmid) [Borrelia coriaceae]|uniref:Uncharacterized protein n=1 Tax=Borrelia coriaceae ATCC 43381 TaxID=1408429 RepID=W5SXJ0_9SPIR|nr:hypothetical protein [Borrelia coriaceae]AHH11864.1 Hypothetical protein BCO_0120300 [Borrelia coriaceae ATCC 43381]UPA17200.1 hypothetical protein bcCo53_001378 [Borrelia coriaceae]UPA17462.1 hypothetical protein bcCo53_001666 [Borrelia coriaceae]
MKFIEQFLSTFKKDLKNYLFYSKLTTTQIYYKSEIYTCTTLKLPVVVFALKSIGEVVFKCKNYSFALSLDFLVYTHCSDHPTLGLEIATLIVNFLVSNYSLESFSIDDSQVSGEDLEDVNMVTVIRSKLGIRLNSSDLGC